MDRVPLCSHLLQILGLSSWDEEHEGAYKSEQAPRYHARETAVHIAKMCGAGVVFGSATPSVEAFYRAKKNEYTLLELPPACKRHTACRIYGGFAGRIKVRQPLCFFTPSTGADTAEAGGKGTDYTFFK